MRSSLRLLLVAASSSALLACAALPDIGSLVGAGSEAALPASEPAPSGARNWAQASSDIPADPAVRFGTLSNGMRYAVMRNASPPGQASLRLHIDAGSLMEEEDQRGLAHFIEHMAFNGTTNIAEGDLLPILERLGLAFGPDTNAFTSFDQTVYQLDLPNTADETVGTGLMILREMAGEASLDAGAIDRERGIVISEERTRASPGYRVAQARYRFLMKGQLLPERFPIGDVDILANAPRDRLADFYEAYYRPERTTLVAVGDFDPDHMEARIREGFRDWSNPAPDGAAPELGEVAPRNSETLVVVEPGAQASLQIAWVSPPDLDPDRLEERREQWIRQLGFSVLNRRFQRLARQQNPPFLGAAAYRSTEYDTIDNATIYANFEPGGWAAALTAAEQEQRRIVEHGVTARELQREITETRTSLQAAVAGSATRRTPALANGIVSAANDDSVLTSPQTDLQIFEAVVSDLTAEQVSTALRLAFEGQGPLVFVSTPVAIDGAEAAVSAALDASRGAPVAPLEADAAMEWPYADMGNPTPVVDQRELPDLETTLVTFANGVQLIVKPTGYRDDQVLVSVRAGDGFQALPRDRMTALWAARTALTEGGLGQLTAEQLEEVLSGRVYGVNFAAGEDAFMFTGATRPADLNIQLQVLAAYLTDAAWRPEPFERLRTLYGQALDQLAATPGGVLSRDGGTLLRSGDQRWAFPNAEQIAAADLGELRAAIGEELAEGPVEVIVVGDIDVDRAIEAVGATFGALPARPEAPPEPDPAREVAFPAPTSDPVRLSHTGRADQGLGLVAWPTVDAGSDVYGSRVMLVLADVLRLRLIEELREGQAVTYSPSVAATSSWTFPGYGYASASIQAPPERLEGFFTDVDRIVAELAETAPTPDELERARRPRIESLLRNKATNEFWLIELQDLHHDEQRLMAIRSQLADLERISPDDLQRAAQAYLRADTAWRLTITPERDR